MVKDPADASVPGAQLILRNTDTGVLARAQTTETGNYAFPSLPVGSYELAVEAAGFKKAVEKQIAIQINQIQRLDIKLEVGAATESITVSSSAEMLKTENAEQSMNVTGQKLNELPINFGGSGTAGGGIRNWLTFTYLAPGVAGTGAGSQVNGLPGGNYKVYLEGQDSTSPVAVGWTSTVQSASVEAITEFTIQSSNYSAEYGQVLGGLYSFTTKSGTNQYHGSAYEEWTSEILNAAQPWNHVRNKDRQNDYGFSVGGPVRLPKIYNGKNRTFFFFNLERYGNNQTSPLVGNVPTMAYRQGDFSCGLFATTTNCTDGDASRGADGFRLDFAQNVPLPFWVTYRKVVKAVKPDAYITGEIWTAASSYLSGDTWDATMQYQFANALQSFFIGGSKKPITASVLAARLADLITINPFQVGLNQMNLLDSHDTDRWASRFVNADRPPPPADPAAGRRGSYNLSKPTDLEWQRMEQSIAVQMTSAGAPMVYYGDEVGMWGATDPDDRQPMIWKDLPPNEDPEVKFNQHLFDTYARLIAIRRKFATLQTGFTHTVLADDARNILVNSRDLGDSHVYVLVNRSSDMQSVDLPIGPATADSAMIDWLDPAQTGLTNASASARDGRPQIRTLPGVKPAVVSHNGKATVSLKPWGTMILAPSGAN